MAEFEGAQMYALSFPIIIYKKYEGYIIVPIPSDFDVL